MRKIAVIMFADIDGYTAIMHRDERQAVRILRRFRERLISLVGRQQGEIIQHYGDGALCTFSSALDAVTCAVQLQRDLGAGVIVPLRIGLHLGEVLVQDGMVVGDAVNIASRIESLALPNTVLLSEKVRSELDNHSEIRTVSLGSFQFKNVELPMQVHAIEAPGISVPDDIRPDAKLARVSQTKGFPKFPGTFVGREAPLHELQQLLLRDDISMITILGAGGLGKTRLAVQVGQQAAPHYADGAVFIGLDGLTEPSQVAGTIGKALGLTSTGPQDWTQLLTDHLRSRQLLLILDNFEHLIHAGALDTLRSLVEHCPNVKLLVTSRTSLALHCETEYQLGPLNKPPSNQDVDGARNNESIALFVQKASQLRAGFRLSSSNLPAIADICRQLDGVPLAIELAASRIKLYKPAQILDGLKDLFQMLATGRSQHTSRHQTMYETIRWSYDLLSVEEQSAFRAYAIFPVSFTLAAAKALFPDASTGILESLLDKSLITIFDSGAATRRFRMLRVIREFGYELLRAHPKEYQRATDRYVRFFQLFLKEHPRSRLGSASSRWLEAIGAEIEHLRLAAHMLADVGAPQDFQPFVLQFWRFFLHRGLLQEGFALIRTALELKTSRADETQADLLIAAGTFAQNLGAYDDAKTYFSQALPVYISQGLHNKTCLALNLLSWIGYRLGHYPRSISYGTDALNLATKYDYRSHVARALNNLAWVALFRGHLNKTEQYLQEVLDIHRRSQNERGMAFAQTILAWIACDRWRLQKAESMCLQALATFEELKDRQLATFTKAILANAYLLQGRRMESRELLVQAVLPAFESIGDSWGQGFAHRLLAELESEENSSIQHGSHLQAAFDIYQRIGDLWGIAKCYCVMARSDLSRRTGTHGREYLRQAKALALDMEAPRLLAEILSLTASYHFADQAWQTSADTYLEAMREARAGDIALYQKIRRDHASEIDHLRSLNHVTFALASILDPSDS